MSGNAMECPYCHFQFRKLAVNANEIPAVAPILCVNCLIVSLAERDIGVRKLTQPEMDAVMASEAGEFLRKAQEILEKIPVEKRI